MNTVLTTQLFYSFIQFFYTEKLFLTHPSGTIINAEYMLFLYAYINI